MVLKIALLDIAGTMSPTGALSPKRTAPPIRLNNQGIFFQADNGSAGPFRTEGGTNLAFQPPFFKGQSLNFIKLKNLVAH